jgi:hypothetical protein
MRSWCQLAPFSMRSCTKESHGKALQWVICLSLLFQEAGASKKRAKVQTGEIVLLDI